MRFIRRWKYTLSMLFGVIIPSVIMLFFSSTREIGMVVLIVTWVAFVSEGLKLL